MMQLSPQEHQGLLRLNLTVASLSPKEVVPTLLLLSKWLSCQYSLEKVCYFLRNRYFLHICNNLQFA